jgi:hypothetical protein
MQLGTKRVGTFLKEATKTWLVKMYEYLFQIFEDKKSQPGWFIEG